MAELLALHRDNFLFQLYLENKVHSVHQGKVLNTLMSKTLEPEKIGVLSRGQRNLFTIQDVPDYLKITYQIPKGMGLKRVPQYYGYLVDLKGIDTIEDFLKKQLSKRNIKNLYSKKRKLDGVGDIEYKVITGPMNKGTYRNLFEDFRQLLIDRFDQKKILNRDLFHWDELYAHTYPKLVDRQALLFIIFKGDKPICITLNYVLDNCMFSHIQTYAVAYSKYNLGDISILFQLEWCLANNISIFDVSKGSNPYKEKWCNHQYRLYHEIWYHKHSIFRRCQAELFGAKLALRQTLRDVGLLGNIIQMDKLLYRRYRHRIKRAITK